MYTYKSKVSSLMDVFTDQNFHFPKEEQFNIIELNYEKDNWINIVTSLNRQFDIIQSYKSKYLANLTCTSFNLLLLEKYE